VIQTFDPVRWYFTERKYRSPLKKILSPVIYVLIGLGSETPPFLTCLLSQSDFERIALFSVSGSRSTGVETMIFSLDG